MSTGCLAWGLFFWCIGAAFFWAATYVGSRKDPDDWDRWED